MSIQESRELHSPNRRTPRPAPPHLCHCSVVSPVGCSRLGWGVWAFPRVGGEEGASTPSPQTFTSFYFRSSL
jgi:hypothetical protein